MVVRILIWSLFDSKTTIDELRDALPDLEPPSAWIWSEASERFGLVAFGDELPKPVFQHVLTTLLNKRGPVDPSDHTVTDIINIPETENHILMIETSRYLTNQLLCEHRLAPPTVCDNGQNGMTAWIWRTCAGSWLRTSSSTTRGPIRTTRSPPC